MTNIFSKILSGEISCHKIEESDLFLAFLDIAPLREGHTLVIPKVEVDYFFDMKDEYLGRINLFAQNVAQKIERVIPCKRIGITVIGLEVPHAHMHLIPINGVSDMNFEKPKLVISQEKLAEIAKSIREA